MNWDGNEKCLIESMHFPGIDEQQQQQKRPFNISFVAAD